MDTVLMLDENTKRAQEIANALFRHGLNIFRIKSAERCAFEARRLQPRVVVAFLSGIGRSVQDVMDKLQLQRAVPVIIVSDQWAEVEELEALDAGASDFLRGDASTTLIARRVLHVLDERQKEANESTKPGSRKALTCGDLELDVDFHTARWAGQDIGVTRMEMDLLISLTEYPGMVKSRESLMNDIHDENIYVDDRTIDSHMKRLRRKIRAVDPEFDAIKTIYGLGYKFLVSAAAKRSNHPVSSEVDSVLHCQPLGIPLPSGRGGTRERLCAASRCDLT